MYEHRRQPLLPRRAFVSRVIRHAGVSLMLVGATLWLGMAGYHWLEGLGWLDAYLNAAMILGGMGPVAEIHTPWGKAFAGTYALFSGVIFLAIMGLIMAPVVHRALHRFHVVDDDERPESRHRPAKD
jgi:hypothetical protein